MTQERSDSIHVQFRDVVYRYPRGGSEVRCADLAVRVGEMLVVLGASGEGKTTLLKLAGGLLDPTSGSVTLGGRRVTSVPPQQRRIGYVPQRLALFAHLSVARNVGFRLWASGCGEAKVHQDTAALLSELGITHLASRRAGELSGGQAQRVAIGRALAGDVSLLLLDEPFASLDRVTQDSALGLLRDVQRVRRVTTVLVTHDRDQAMAVADRIALVADGRVRQVGTPREVYNRPRHASLALLAGAGTLLPGRVVENGGGSVVVETPLGLTSTVWMDDTRVPPGTACQVLARPEWLSVTPAVGSPWNLAVARWGGRHVEVELSREGHSVKVVGGDELLSLQNSVSVSVKDGVVCPSYPLSSNGGPND